MLTADEIIVEVRRRRGEAAGPVDSEYTLGYADALGELLEWIEDRQP